MSAVCPWPSRSPSPKRRATHPSWIYSLAGALAVAWGAALVLRPGKGLIEPDPVDVQDYFSTDDIVRARRFGHPQLALQAASTLVRAAVLLRFIDKPLAPGRGNRPLLEAAVAGAGLSAAVGLAPLPLRVLMRRRALAVGLARQSWGGWVLDLLKSSTIEIGLSGGSAAAAVWLMRRHPRGWWLAFSGASVAGAALFTFLAPVLLDPIFNRFEVLADGDLRREVFELAERAQVNVGEVYQVDASSRTSAANAYVSGFAHTKRVVLFDTLIQSFTAEETRLVVAHELAHVRHRDLPRGLAHLALSAPGGMYGASCLLRALGRHPEQTQASAQTLPALALALSVVGVTVGSPSAALSRRVEQRADAFSLKLTDEPEPFIAFERRIVSQNLADPDPPRWLVRLMASHPPAVERIGIALAYARAR